ncbi:hypothetical protein KTE62_31140, partial [Burkholderia multivorans]|nr:hypothetical protein [Burkholderia multivorans]
MLDTRTVAVMTPRQGRRHDADANPLTRSKGGKPMKPDALKTPNDAWRAGCDLALRVIAQNR